MHAEIKEIKIAIIIKKKGGNYSIYTFLLVCKKKLLDSNQ